jgi:hypothetical protein
MLQKKNEKQILNIIVNVVIMEHTQKILLKNIIIQININYNPIYNKFKLY